MRITRVETNIKRAESIIIDINEKGCLIVGPNGSGKTSILNAIELALTGEAMDLGVKKAAKSSTILRYLRHEHADTVYANVYLEDGSVFKWSLGASGGVKRSIPEGYVVCFPLREAYDALAGGRETVLKYLTKLIPEHIPSKFVSTLAQNKRRAAKAKDEAKQIRITIDSLLSLFGINLTESKRITKLVGTQGNINKVALFRAMQFLVNTGIKTVGRQQVDTTLLRDRTRDKTEFISPQASELFLDKLPFDIILSLILLEKKEAILLDSAEALTLEYKRMLETLAEIVESHSADICSQIDIEIGRQTALIITATQVKFGWVDNSGSALPFTSGAETIVLAAAMGVAATPAMRKAVAGKKNKVIVLTTPDRNLDPTTIRLMQQWFIKLPATSFIQTVSPPPGRPSKGWQIIRCGGPQ